MTQIVDAEWLSQQINDASVKGITLAASTLIRDGQIAVGMQMPAVRDWRNGWASVRPRYPRLGAAEEAESAGG